MDFSLFISTEIIPQSCFKVVESLTGHCMDLRNDLYFQKEISLLNILAPLGQYDHPKGSK